MRKLNSTATATNLKVHSRLAGASTCNRPGRKGLTSVLVLLGGLSLLGTGDALGAGKQDIEPCYAKGQLYHMITSYVTTDPSPQLLAQSEELYLMVYPINPDGSTDLGAVTLPSGHQPNCNPCFHTNLPLEFVYHDHLLNSAPGLGANGTDGEFEVPRKVIILVYNPDFALDPDFTPIKDTADIEAAEAGGEFLPVNPEAANPFEIDTGNVVMCSFVSPHH